MCVCRKISPTVQGVPCPCRLGLADLYLGDFPPGWWAAIVDTYCPNINLPWGHPLYSFYYPWHKLIIC